MDKYPSEYYYWPVVSVFILNSFVYVIAQIIKDNSIMDINWGVSFIVPNLVLLILNENWN